MTKNGDNDQGEPDVEKQSVGYKKPPRDSRFQRGRSGNPKGRRRGRKSFRNSIQDALQQLVAVQNGKRKMPAQDILAKNVVARALHNKPKSISDLFMLMKVSAYVEGDTTNLADAPLTESDAELVADFLRRRGISVEKDEASATDEKGPKKRPDDE